jgi:hypothetical protein
LVLSPQVNPDKTVVFRYLAPSAKDVRLSTQFEKGPVAMKKDSKGIWSVTVGPVNPDIYPYNFIVDGIQVMDPGNVAFFPNERFKESLVDIPGETPFTKDMINDIIPFVEANYPVLTDSNHRAVAGFSVSGGQTLNIGLTNTLQQLFKE